MQKLLRLIVYIYIIPNYYIIRIIISFPTDLWIEDCYCGSRLNWYIRKYVLHIFFFLLSRLRRIYFRAYIFSFDRIYALERYHDKCIYSLSFFLSLFLSLSFCLEKSCSKKEKANGKTVKAGGWQSEREKT